VVEWALLDKNGPLLMAQLAGPHACVCIFVRVRVYVKPSREDPHNLHAPETPSPFTQPSITRV
jgi:hypothetical protein